ncbi:hypothetical protein DSO57_1006563 [Entomophthora muscae]|uniref:Uncharacterized protein n=1 Tax=Entomophthora muscae TaxID=34485 RepID=A0ACC2TVD1_9FUNG|nr:hypothetical protein DSO57_1006563 [Entomophthora muscae]
MCAWIYSLGFVINGVQLVIGLSWYTLALLDVVRNIHDIYSWLLNKLSLAATKQTSAVTEQTSATNVQTSAIIKQIHTATCGSPPQPRVHLLSTCRQPLPQKTSTATAQAPAATSQKPVTTKPSPAATKQTSAANTQTLTTIKQMPIATAQALNTLTSPTCKPSSNQAPMGQPATCQPLPSHASRPVPIHFFRK